VELENEVKCLPPEDIYLFRAFSPMGWLSKVIPNYQMREGQLRLANRVHRALRDGTDLAAEGPVGLGKSFAYGVPLAYHTALQGRGLIVTANIALQEQLCNKDLPLLQSALPWDFGFTLLKGRNNYLCLDALEDLYQKQPNGKVHLQMLDEQEQTQEHMKIAAWAKTTKTGDRSELTFEPSPKVWQRFSVTSEECLGSNCLKYEQCFPNKARELAQQKESNIYVTNYHLFFGTMSRGRDSGFLPAFDYVILDEAHSATDIARDFFGFKITENSLRWVSSRIHADPGLRRSLETSSMQLFQMLRAVEQSKEYSTRFRGPLRPDLYERVTNDLLLASAYFNSQMANNKALALNASGQNTKNKLWKMSGIAEHAQKAARTLATRIDMALGYKNLDLVYSLEMDREQLTLVAKRLRPTEDMEYDDSVLTVGSRILVSATLTVGGSFDPLVNELKETVPELGLRSSKPFVAESPFHWVTQARLIVPEVLPNPRSKDEFQAQSALAIGYCIQQARGRTLALFTSWKALEATYVALKDKTPYRLLKQGEMPRTRLVEEFKKDTSSVLFGVGSFWSGIDVPGEALSCLIIDKLPFPSPDDPVIDALEHAAKGSPFQDDVWQEGNSAFRKYSIPRMILAMRQGFGRLIRSTGDRGVVVLLDKRVHTNWENYGRLLVNSLPRVSLSTDLDDVARFLS